MGFHDDDAKHTKDIFPQRRQGAKFATRKIKKFNFSILCYFDPFDNAQGKLREKSLPDRAVRETKRDFSLRSK
jgi:hypothetical protein